jgi:hypothetical protein
VTSCCDKPRLDKDFRSGSGGDEAEDKEAPAMNFLDHGKPEGHHGWVYCPSRTYGVRMWSGMGWDGIVRVGQNKAKEKNAKAPQKKRQVMIL